MKRKSMLLRVALYPKRNKVKAEATDDDDQHHRRRRRSNFSHKTAKVSIFHARKNVRSDEAQTERRTDGSGSSKCVTRARCKTA